MGALGPKPLARLVESRCQIFSRIQRIQFNSVTRRGVFNVVCFAGCFFYGSYKFATRKKVEQALNADGGAAPPFPEIKSTHSLVAKHVTPEKWAKLGGLKTQTSGFTLGQAIACAVEFGDQHCGIYAGDQDFMNYLLMSLIPSLRSTMASLKVSLIHLIWMLIKL